MFLWPKYGSMLHVLLGRSIRYCWRRCRISTHLEFHGENILQTVSTRAITAQRTANADEYGLFWLLFNQHELLMGADDRDSKFVILYSGSLLFKAGRKKPQYFFAVLRRKIWTIFKTKSMYRTHWLYLRACRGVQDHLCLPVMIII